jgi:O-antigen ligase
MSRYDTSKAMTSGYDTILSPEVVRIQRLATGVIIALMFYITLTPWLTFSPVVGQGDGNPFRQIVFIILLGLAFVAAQVFKDIRQAFVVPISMCIVLAWFGLSMVWSIAPNIGLRRLLLTIIVIWTVYLMVKKAGYENTLTAIRIILPLALIGNYLAVLGWPDWAIHQSATETDPSIVGAWRGYMMQKNFAGAICAFTILFFFLDARKLSWVVKGLVILAAAFFLYKTESKTSMGILAVTLTVALLYRLYNPRYRYALIGVLVLATAVAIYIGYGYLGLVNDLLAREDAFTGRSKIWSIMLQYIRDHGLLGSGYGAFWNIGNASPIFQYTSGWVSELGNGHSGYLDIYAQTGVVGFILSVIVVFLIPMFRLITNTQIARNRATLIVACIFFCLGHNFTESTLFDRDSAVHVFLVLALALMHFEMNPKAR